MGGREGGREGGGEGGREGGRGGREGGKEGGGEGGREDENILIHHTPGTCTHKIFGNPHNKTLNSESTYGRKEDRNSWFSTHTHTHTHPLNSRSPRI